MNNQEVKKKAKTKEKYKNKIREHILILAWI
jgi:hypothetical protein